MKYIKTNAKQLQPNFLQLKMLEGTSNKYDKGTLLDANFVDDLIGESGGGSREESISYSDLKTLVLQKKLKPGQYYRITDYECIVKDSRTNIRSAGHRFDIIVLAISDSELDENAYAAHHDGDTYFANSDLAAWEIKYTIENDTTKYYWANEERGKGVIYEMKDEYDNKCPYDFKNIQFRRFLLNPSEETPVAYLGHKGDQPDQRLDDKRYEMFAEIQSVTTDDYRLEWIGKYIHRYNGYYTEQQLYDAGYTDSFEGKYVIEDGGTRIFCALGKSNGQSNGIIIQVEKEVWCYTFSYCADLYEDFTDYSLSQNIHHCTIAIEDNSTTYANLYSNVFITSPKGHSQTINGEIVYTPGNFVHVNINHFAADNTIGCEARELSIGGYFTYNLIEKSYQSNFVGYTVYTNIYDSCYRASVTGLCYLSNIYTMENSSIGGIVNDCLFYDGIEETSISGTAYRVSYKLVSGSTIQGYFSHLICEIPIIHSIWLGQWMNTGVRNSPNPGNHNIYYSIIGGYIDGYYNGVYEGWLELDLGDYLWHGNIVLPYHDNAIDGVAKVQPVTFEQVNTKYYDTFADNQTLELSSIYDNSNLISSAYTLNLPQKPYAVLQNVERVWIKVFAVHDANSPITFIPKTGYNVKYSESSAPIMDGQHKTEYDIELVGNTWYITIKNYDITNE